MQRLSVKNSLIALLSLLCLFLLLYALGAFNYSEGSFSDSYKSFSKRRSKAVNKAPAWNIAVMIPESSSIGRGALLGVTYAVERINAKGGVLGKPLVLRQRPGSADSMENKFHIQEWCEQADTALLLGPWFTAETLAVRGITQFQALPALSITLAEDLPPLEPDIFLSVLPPLSVLIDPILDDLKARGYKRILLVSPEKNHYGGQFASRLEREIGLSDFFEEVFRTDYTPKADFQTLYQALKLYRNNVELDALVFTGDESDFVVLGRAMRALGITAPVYGSDLLDVPNIKELHAADFFSELTYPELRADFFPGWEQNETMLEDMRRNSLWAQYGALCITLFSAALEKTGAYDPALLVGAMREQLQNAFHDRSPMVQTIVVRFPGVRPDVRPDARPDVR